MKNLQPMAIGWWAAFLIIPSLALADKDKGNLDEETSIVVEEAEFQYEDLSQDEDPDEKAARKKAILSNLEPGLGLGVSSWDGNFTMQINTSLGYYVLNWLQPGLEFAYVTDFGSSNYPDSFRILPFLKFVFMRGKSFAPYVMVAGGREFQWAGDYPVDSWIVGPGVGAYIGAGKRIVINIEVLFLHYWYDDPRVVRYPDDSLYEHDDGNTYFCPDSQCDLDGWVVREDELCPGYLANSESCVDQADDKKDRDREWIFPIISLGVGFLF